jgi:hypothetical protein
MARIAVVCPDLLFGSKLAGMLRAAGHEVVAPDGGPELAIVDLTDDAEARIAGAPRGVPLLGVYSHVEVDVRRRAEAAGFDLVVPRSRMAREGAALVAGLLE